MVFVDYKRGTRVISQARPRHSNKCLHSIPGRVGMMRFQFPRYPWVFVCLLSIQYERQVGRQGD